jgi:hypothetical protein
MKCTLIGLLFGFVLSACGRGTSSQVTADSEFMPYLVQFDGDSAIYGVPAVQDHISVQFGEVLAGEIGLCHPGTLIAAPYITIDKFQWDQLIDSERAALIYHELGHCVLGQSHRGRSIMQSPILSGNTFDTSRKEYVQELFDY